MGFGEKSWILIEMFMWHNSQFTFIVYSNCKPICLFIYDKLKWPAVKWHKKLCKLCPTLRDIVCVFQFLFSFNGTDLLRICLVSLLNDDNEDDEDDDEINRKHLKHKNRFPASETIQQTTWELRDEWKSWFDDDVEKRGETKNKIEEFGNRLANQFERSIGQSQNKYYYNM